MENINRTSVFSLWLMWCASYMPLSLLAKKEIWLFPTPSKCESYHLPLFIQNFFCCKQTDGLYKCDWQFHHLEKPDYEDDFLKHCLVGSFSQQWLNDVHQLFGCYFMLHITQQVKLFNMDNIFYLHIM